MLPVDASPKYQVYEKHYSKAKVKFRTIKGDGAKVTCNKVVRQRIVG